MLTAFIVGARHADGDCACMESLRLRPDCDHTCSETVGISVCITRCSKVVKKRSVSRNQSARSYWSMKMKVGCKEDVFTNAMKSIKLKADWNKVFWKKVFS